MHDRLSRLGALAVIGSLVACAPGSDPVAPEEDGVSLSQASVTNGTGTFSFDKTQWWDCAGEMIHNVFQISYSYTLVLLPTGEYVYRELWPYGAVGTITGLSSGTVWTRITVSPYVERSTGGGMVTYTGLVKFVSETGPTIQVHESFHVSNNANGEVTADHDEFDCKQR